jgi:hypothetical protein
VSARKIGFLILILAFGGIVETAWHVRESHFAFGPEGFRVLGGRFYGPSFTFEESAERLVEADQALEVEVRNAFGGVRIVPGPGPEVEIKLRKVVFQPTEERARAFADRVELRLEEEEGRLRVGTNRDDVGRKENVGFETHLELLVPPDTRAWIWNDHGRVEVSGIARADVRTSFDDVRVERITGPVKIDSRQGAVEASDLGAELTLKSRHGDVEVVGIAGPLDLDVQHGKLTARRTAGVEAKVSYGQVVADHVEGDVRVEARHAGARIEDVSGEVEVQTSYERIRLERIGGNVWASTREGGVTAQTLGGGVHVRARGDDVSIDGFRGPVDVENDGGDVLLVTATPITEAMTVSVRRGGVRLEVPPGSRFDLEAESRRGDLLVDVPELDRSGSDATDGGRATGTIGGGGVLVKLTADDDVTLAARRSAPPAEKP